VWVLFFNLVEINEVVLQSQSKFNATICRDSLRMTNVVVNDKVMFFSGSPLLEGWHSDYRNDGVFRNILMIFGILCFP
jgi:hypothetical protein